MLQEENDEKRLDREVQKKKKKSDLEMSSDLTQSLLIIIVFFSALQFFPALPTDFNLKEEKTYIQVMMGFLLYREKKKAM